MLAIAYKTLVGRLRSALRVLDHSSHPDEATQAVQAGGEDSEKDKETAEDAAAPPPAETPPSGHVDEPEREDEDPAPPAEPVVPLAEASRGNMSSSRRKSLATRHALSAG